MAEPHIEIDLASRRRQRLRSRQDGLNSRAAARELPPVPPQLVAEYDAATSNPPAARFLVSGEHRVNDASADSD
jgi:hypothetical protein